MALMRFIFLQRRKFYGSERVNFIMMVKQGCEIYLKI